MPTHGQSGLLADRSRQVGVEGEQEAGRVRGIEWNERGPGLPARPGRSGTAAPGHRPALFARADGRGSQVRRDRTEVGERRCRRRIVAAAIAASPRAQQPAAQTMFASNQYLFDTKGRKFSADATANMYDDSAKLMFEEINPGNSIKGLSL